ncbi:MAG: biotin/lipoyl-containing protein [Vicinamibacterales bacterium]
MSAVDVARIGPGAYAVTIEGRREIVYVAVSAKTRWASCRGEVFREAEDSTDSTDPTNAGRDTQGARRDKQAALPLAAPMPATVLKVLVTPGAVVKRGDTLVILEAMKMELPLRASADAVVSAVHCHAGELVKADTVLVELA